jgi:hypothetical protein
MIAATMPLRSGQSTRRVAVLGVDMGFSKNRAPNQTTSCSISRYIDREGTMVAKRRQWFGPTDFIEIVVEKWPRRARARLSSYELGPVYNGRHERAFC